MFTIIKHPYIPNFSPTSKHVLEPQKAPKGPKMVSKLLQSIFNVK